MSSEKLADRLKQARTEALRPPPRLSLVEWADQFRVIAKQNSANPGEWKTARVPIAYGPMMAVTENDTQVISMMACTQIIKSETLINITGYFIHQDPASILFVQPTQKLAESFSKERFNPTRDATPVLRALVADAKSRDSGTTITHKEYPGGTLDFVGANSPVDLASRPKRITVADEIDLYPADAGGMGDPLALAEERSSTFKKRRKNVRACSPSDEATSRIYREYRLSDQRRCFVACPHCRYEQTLKWTPETVVWSRDEDGNHLYNTVRYHCEKCGVGWSEAERMLALRDLVNASDWGWRQTKPFKCCGIEQDPQLTRSWNERGRSTCFKCKQVTAYEGHAGFHVSKLYSTRHDLGQVVKEWLDAQGKRDKLKKFVNTALAEVWKEKMDELDPKSLSERREPYNRNAAPAGVRMVTFGGDTQDDRIECTLLGWGYNDECWVLEHQVLYGDTSKIAIWNEFDTYIKQAVFTVDGRRLLPQAGGVDSQGHRGAMVHAFCRARKFRRIYALKGVGNDHRGSKLIWPRTQSRTKNQGDKLYLVGVDTAKDDLFARLRIQIAEGGMPSPRAVHFPMEGLSADYFDQLTAEQAVIEFKDNVAYRRWMKKSEDARNEALDCFVYGLAAYLSLPARLDRAPDRANMPATPEASAETPVDASDDVQESVAPVPAVVATASKAKNRKNAWARR